MNKLRLKSNDDLYYYFNIFTFNGLNVFDPSLIIIINKFAVITLATMLMVFIIFLKYLSVIITKVLMNSILILQQNKLLAVEFVAIIEMNKMYQNYSYFKVTDVFFLR